MRILLKDVFAALFSLGLYLGMGLSPAHAEIRMQNGEIKLGIGQRPGVLHGVVMNHSNSATRWIGASSSAFERIELHTHTKSNDGTMRMHPVEGYALPAMGSVRLKPAGDHLMLFGFTGKAGDTVTLRLSFADGRSLEVEAPTKARAKHKGQSSPAHDMPHDMSHDMSHEEPHHGAHP
ncbi:MAG: copper chaperone PCu(A)C [Rhodobiaceae bacterium]|jgi:copper(I)-binding protein|nr:copper chaperone PCu(A)C [Rhodobiaceae bacterium]